MQWRPSANLSSLHQRAELLARLRRFFADRSILEVETPLLCRSGITDPSIEPFIVVCGESPGQRRFLQTSPEYAMKRLLAAFGEPIFQISKAFRDGEAGARHNPEFSLLEWYRPGFDHHRLMAEVADLVQQCLGERPLQTYSYRQLFQERLQVDPFTAAVAELETIARRHLDPGGLSGDRDLWLDLLMSHVLEPQLGDGTLCFIHDYPVSQAALARVVQADDIQVGQRFELYVEGVELANGYCELTDAPEQRQRFERDNALRRQRGQCERPVDEHLLAALAHGLPACSGVALGLDRLLMLATGATDISAVLAFDWERS
ncbi:MAG TPA: EF-P lysine aminoacylase EpmA [Halioglobus sp.]